MKMIFDSSNKSRLFIAGYIIFIYSTLSLARGLTNSLQNLLGIEGYGLLVNVFMILCGTATLMLTAQKGWKTLLAISFPVAIIASTCYFIPYPSEKIHFVEYGALGILVFRTIPSGLNYLILAFLFIALVGAGDELIQWYLPNRVGDMRDVYLNAMSGFLGLWIGKIYFS